MPPKSAEELEADEACNAAREALAEATKKHEAAATSLKRTISGSQMQAVRLPTPSQLELEAPPPKR
jgi:hypothetical protein